MGEVRGTQQLKTVLCDRNEESVCLLKLYESVQTVTNDLLRRPEEAH